MIHLGDCLVELSFIWAIVTVMVKFICKVAALDHKIVVRKS